VLPPPQEIDFGALARSIETIQILIAALEHAWERKRLADIAAEQKRIADAVAAEKRRRRIREEEALVMILAQII